LSSPTENFSIEQARRIASCFHLTEPVEVYDFHARGNINYQAYLILAGPPDNRKEHILQLLNPLVFTQPLLVMGNMTACIQAQQSALSRGLLRADEEWVPITLVPTLEGKNYLEQNDEQGVQCWRMMDKISDTQTFRSLNEILDRREQLRLAEEAGKGLALFNALTAGMDAHKLACPLPGYRDTRFYFNQLMSVTAGCRTVEEAAPYLPADPFVRRSNEHHFLIHLPQDEFHHRMDDPQLSSLMEMIRGQKAFGLTLQKELEAGSLKKVVVHGDTKLENFLFSGRTGKVKALVDLDTVMPHTWLSDWGDMIRSLANPAGEREPDPGKIRVDMDIFIAVARGFLESARGITLHETELMVDASRIMAFELGVRFLADYLRGDTYFKLRPADPSDLNKTRAMVQFRVFEELQKEADAAFSCIRDLCRQVGIFR
jgi:hypothetical protein